MRAGRRAATVAPAHCQDSSEFPSLLLRPAALRSRRRALERAGARVREVSNRGRQAGLEASLADLAALKTMHVWVEGGSAGLYVLPEEGSPTACRLRCPQGDGGGGSITPSRIRGAESQPVPWLAVDGLRRPKAPRDYALSETAGEIAMSRHRVKSPRWRPHAVAQRDPLTVAAPGLAPRWRGGSVAVNGACQTVTEPRGHIRFDSVAETLRKTTLASGARAHRSPGTRPETR